MVRLCLWVSVTDVQNKSSMRSGLFIVGLLCGSFSWTLHLNHITVYVIWAWVFGLHHFKLSIIAILGCSYRASSVCIAIRLPTDATLYLVYLFPFLPYMFRALISPSSGVSQAVFYINHLVHVVFMLLICVCMWTGLSWWFHCTVNPPRQTIDSP